MNADELRAAVSAYMHRTDPETIANEPTAIELARLKLSRWFFPELASMTVVLTFTDAGDGSAFAPLPDDFGQADVLYVTGRGDLEYLTPRDFTRALVDKTRPNGYTIAGDVLQVQASLATLDGALSYYRAPEPITGAAINWCSDAYADVWMWQAIAEQHRFVQDAESAQLAEAYAEELGSRSMDSTRANRQGGALRMTAR